jgi:hypothetical protein
MKVNIGPYKNYFGPYQIAEKIFFWKENNYEEDNIIEKFGYWLSTTNGKQSRFSKFCYWLNSKSKRKIKVHIDNYDVWSMDRTLALIILPMLNKLKEDKMSSPYTDPSDVPEELRPNNGPDGENGYLDNTHHERWTWIIDEMIFAFEHIANDEWENEFIKDDETATFGITIDRDGIKKDQERIDNGVLLFGKYFQSLWS